MRSYDIGHEAGKAGDEVPILPAGSGISDLVLCQRGWSDGRSSKLQESHNLLGELAHYLLRNYPDDWWNDTTRELLEKVSLHMGWVPITWNLDEEDE